LRKIEELKPLNQLKTISKITIHGTKNKIIPIYRNKKYDFEIYEAGHFFTLTPEKEINTILKNELSRN